VLWLSREVESELSETGEEKEGKRENRPLQPLVGFVDTFERRVVTIVIMDRGGKDHRRGFQARRGGEQAMEKTNDDDDSPLLLLTSSPSPPSSSRRRHFFLELESSLTVSSMPTLLSSVLPVPFPAVLTLLRRCASCRLLTR
jgi:hypothetical protein